jgi:hypothetical protein
MATPQVAHDIEIGAAVTGRESLVVREAVTGRDRE